LIGEGRERWAAAWLANGLVPLAVAAAVNLAVQRWAPSNPFAYFFGAAFGGGALSMLASAMLRGLPGAVALMLAFGEAFLTGTLVTLLVVYRRDWVATFDDRRWLRSRGGG
jgi:uncharacterized membrane protein